MRIIEWNCQGTFRPKNKEIFELRPDILIVPACEKEEKLEFGKLTPKPNDFLWYGDTGKKGIGIFSFSNYKFRLLKELCIYQSFCLVDSEVLRNRHLRVAANRYK
ncbi:MAG: hypothetical protein SH857_14765 [Chitinophagales bacterium]|nr:hypothetical protein [Chitinophagales bacterium]